MKTIYILPSAKPLTHIVLVYYGHNERINASALGKK